MAVQRRGESLQTVARAPSPRAQHPARRAKVVLHLQRPAFEALRGGVEPLDGFFEVGRGSTRGGQVHGRRRRRGGLVRVRERVRPGQIIRRVRILESLKPGLRVLGVSEALDHRLGQPGQPVVIAPQLRLEQLQPVGRGLRRPFQIPPLDLALRELTVGAGRRPGHLPFLITHRRRTLLRGLVLGQPLHAVQQLRVLPRGYDHSLQLFELLLRLRRQLAPLRVVAHRLAVGGAQERSLGLREG